MADDIPGLNDLQANTPEVRRPRPIGQEGRSVLKVTQIEELPQVALPALLALAAATRGGDSKAFELAIKATTGIKPLPGGSAVTPLAVMNIAPQPIGMLPERFFMGKPQVPGTNLYLDPVYTFNQYRGRRRQREYDAVAADFRESFIVVLPLLRDEDLVNLFTQTDLRRENIPLIQPRDAHDILFAEIERRRVIRERAEALARAQRIARGEGVPGVDFPDEFADEFFANNPPDP